MTFARASFMLILLGICSLFESFGQEKPKEDRYAVIKNRVDYQVNSKRVGTIGEGTVVRVDSVHGDWLWVGAHQAYLAKEDAVPLAEAVAHYTKKIEGSKTSANLLQRSKLYRSAGEYDLGIADANEAIRVNPADMEAFVFRGLLYQDKKDYEQAVNAFSDALKQLDTLKKEPALADFTLLGDRTQMVNARVIVLNNRGWSHSERQNLDEALADFDRAILLEPKYARALLNRAVTWERKGERDKALADYNEVLRLVPNHAKTWNHRGRIHFSKGNVDQAIADYDAAIKLDPNLGLAFIHRRAAWEAKGAWDKLAAELDALSENPSLNAFSNNSIAWFKATCPVEKYRDGKKAVDFATIACEQTNWKEAGMMDTLAASFAESGDFEKAVETQTKALELASAELKKEYTGRLELYREKKVFRSGGK